MLDLTKQCQTGQGRGEESPSLSGPAMSGPAFSTPPNSPAKAPFIIGYDHGNENSQEIIAIRPKSKRAATISGLLQQDCHLQAQPTVLAIPITKVTDDDSSD